MPPAGTSAFPPTRWTMLRSAQAEVTAPGAMKALEEWCATYRRPIVTAARVKHGLSPEDAEDVAQEFIVWLLNREHLARAEPLPGSKFRTFLLAYLANFTGNWKQRRAAERRGGRAGEHLLVHDSGDASKPAVEIPFHATPAEEVDRAWVLATLRDVRARLKAAYAAKQKERECEILMKCLSANDRAGTTELAMELGISEGALKVRVHRFRQEFRDMLRDTVRETVLCEEDLEDELALVRKFAAGA